MREIMRNTRFGRRCALNMCDALVGQFLLVGFGGCFMVGGDWWRLVVAVGGWCLVGGWV